VSEVFEVTGLRRLDKLDYYSCPESERPVVLRVPVEQVETLSGSPSSWSVLSTLRILDEEPGDGRAEYERPMEDHHGPIAF
jgi:hypothetical protein